MTRKHTQRTPFIAAIVVALIAIPASATVGTLPAGTAIAVSITSPADGAVFVTPAGGSVDVAVTGTASVGEEEPDATLAYIVDVSDSTRMGGGPCGDPNGDGMPDTIVDCEVAAVLELNAAALSKGSVDEVGLGVFGLTGAAADMTPGGRDDPITSPAGGDLNTVVASIHLYDGNHEAGVSQYTHKDVGGGATNFQAGLEAGGTIVAASSNSHNIVVFLSDGASNMGNDFATALQALVDAGAVVHAFAVGTSASCTGGSHGTLQEMADATGGACTQVTDPSTLPDILPDLVASTLDQLDLVVDAGAPTTLTAGQVAAALPLQGAAGTTFSTSADDLGMGTHSICMTASGSDSGGSGAVTDCVRVHVVGRVPVDIHPTSCPNPINTGSRGFVPVAILGTADLDVASIDASSARLEGVPAHRWSIEDVATPHEGAMRAADDCTTNGADGLDDLTLKFAAQDLAAAIAPATDGEVRILELTAQTNDGADLVGHDVVVILAKK